MKPARAVPGFAAGAKDDACPSADASAVFDKFFAVLRRCEAALAPPHLPARPAARPPSRKPRPARRTGRGCEAGATP